MPTDTATIIAIAAFVISILGPLFTGLFSLRQTRMQNEHALSLANLDVEQSDQDFREKRRQEAKMYYIQLLNSLIDTLDMYVQAEDKKSSELRIKATMLSIPDTQIRAILESEATTYIMCLQVIGRLGVLIHDQLQFSLFKFP